MTSIRLSICIATLNRATFLDETLHSIVSQATDEVEIVIIDGASTDNTEQVVRQYQQAFPRLSYLRLPVKGGVDQDYCKAVQLAQGDYCWLMSDDDILKPGAIQAVLQVIGKNYVLVIVNSEVRTFDLSLIVEARKLHINADRIYRPVESEDLFVDTANYLSFIGCVVIQRLLWNQREKERYFGTVFVHVGVIFQSPLPGDALVLAEPWISVRYGNALWMAKSFEIWMFKWPDLIWSFPNYADSAKRKICWREPWRRIRALVRYRADAAYSLEEYHRLLHPRLHMPWERFLARAIAQLPGCGVNLTSIIYFSFIKRSEPTELLDLKNCRFYYLNCLARIIRGIKWALN